MYAPLQQLLKMEEAEENLEVHFNSKCEKVDLDHRRVTFQQEGAAASTAMDYDLLVGTDGVSQHLASHSVRAAKSEDGRASRSALPP